MNILGIGAHFDDLDLGCSGTLLKHIAAGDKVTMLVITDSAYRNPDGEEIRAKDIAWEEGKKAAQLIGAELICLNLSTFEVPFNESLTKQLQKHIDELKIDTIYSHWDGDLHRDHSMAAKCALMAGRHIPRFLMYRSNYYETGSPFNGNFYSDISEFMDKKLEVIKTHKSELERVNHAWLDFFEKQNANHGSIIGVNYAECFKIVRYLV
ncbi:PIG-L deacetylase family protein [Salidesulfovibrio onnuriiensis]|uniref:PIG-L deacetylase family protein n=1 Tax=Salidesulfovibrio onnuriiensis TaxID=2583823 RepID=UPI0011CCA959|nr:PIG-L family deacetylase [Salidesulfovibrio onnuriiensis]